MDSSPKGVEVIASSCSSPMNPQQSCPLETIKRRVRRFPVSNTLDRVYVAPESSKAWRRRTSLPRPEVRAPENLLCRLLEGCKNVVT